MGKRELTNRQEAILRFVRQELEQKGFPPSVREIGKAVGLSSSSTVHSHLRNLEKKGLIRRHPAKPRTIEVLSGGERRKPATHVPFLANPLVTLPATSPDNVVRHYAVPDDWGPADKVMVVPVIAAGGEARVHEGDYLVVLTNVPVGSGETVVVQDGQQLRAVRCTEAVEPGQVVGGEGELVGKVVGLIRRFV